MNVILMKRVFFAGLLTSISLKFPAMAALSETGFTIISSLSQVSSDKQVKVALVSKILITIKLILPKVNWPIHV